MVSIHALYKKSEYEKVVPQHSNGLHRTGDLARKNARRFESVRTPIVRPAGTGTPPASCQLARTIAHTIYYFTINLKLPLNFILKK